MTLFDHQGKIERGKLAPLSTRMRPESFDDFIGQEHIVGPNSVLRKSIDSDQIPSLILWGPPGSGKTTLAYLISDVTKSYFASLSAVSSGVADLRRIASEAKNRLDMYSQRTILFVDEIHRFNKSQQDIVLPYVEDGIFVLIGATTENPSFEVISPLLSRSKVLTLNALSFEDLNKILSNAFKEDIILSQNNYTITPIVKDKLIMNSGGDARKMLNTIDIAISPQQATISALLTHVRRGDIVNVYSLRKGAAEAIEAVAHGDEHTSKVVGRAIADIKLPAGTTIGAIVRNDDVLIAHDDTVIQSGDHVIMFLIDKKHITVVEKLFQVSAIFL